MLALVVLVPVVLGVLPNRMLRNPNARINLPNPEYWLAQLSSQGLMSGLAVFLLVTVGWVMLFLGHFRRAPR